MGTGMDTKEEKQYGSVINGAEKMVVIVVTKVFIR